MNNPSSDRMRVFDRTLEDLQDDAVRKGGTLNRTDVDAMYLKRGLTPEEAVAMERALTASGVGIKELADEPEAAPEPVETVAKAPTALDHLLRAARKYPLLNRDQEVECGDAIASARHLASDADDPVSQRIRARAEDAKTLLITRNIRLVVKVAFDRRYRGRMDAEDLVQMGLIGLMRASERFDPSWETRFSTYATWWIRQAMSRGLADHGTTVRVPVHMRQAISVFRRKARSLKSAKTPVSLDAVAEKLGWTPEYTAKVATFAEQRTVSIEAPIGGEDSLTLQDVIADARPHPEDMAVANDLNRRVRELLDELGDDRLTDIITRRFGLNGVEETLQEIGDDYGITRERIRQLEDKAIRKLRLRAIKARLAPPGKGKVET